MSERRVLVVAPSAGSGELATALSREGFATRRVGLAAEGLREIHGPTPPDAVLMELSLPDMDGLQALRQMKAARDPAFLPVLLLAPRGEMDRRVSALLGGADDFIARPCPVDEVAARVAVMLRIKAAQDGLQLTNRELERLSITDSLTGLFNRRYFEHRLRQEVERSTRYGDPVALMLLDLDHFKQVNDRYGHHTGDAALHLAATLVRDELRRMDVCTRWGGEEFAAIMPQADRTGAVSVCERVQAALRSRARLSASALEAPDAGPEPIQLAASIGVAVYPSREIAGAEQLIERADAALYEAKRAGRDRICIAPVEGWIPRPAALRNEQAACA